jgi:peptidoglycan/LPS O-acetylase OafA/YrhL
MLEKLPKYSVWFDFIRGCAALAVFIGHARVLFLSSIVAEIGLVSKTRVSPALTTTESISFSHQAVIIFFVVSGYFVGGSVIRGLRSNTWSSTDYIIQRLTRLWTVLVPALALTTLLDLTGISIFGTDGIYGSPLGQRMVFPNILDRLTIETFISNLCFIQVIAAPTYGTNSPLWTVLFIISISCHGLMASNSIAKAVDLLCSFDNDWFFCWLAYLSVLLVLAGRLLA